MHDEVWRFNVRGGGQVLQDNFVGLLQPQIHSSQRVVVERTDPQQTQVTVVNVQNLKQNVLNE